VIWATSDARTRKDEKGLHGHDPSGEVRDTGRDSSAVAGVMALPQNRRAQVRFLSHLPLNSGFVCDMRAGLLLWPQYPRQWRLHGPYSAPGAWLPPWNLYVVMCGVAFGVGLGGAMRWRFET